MSLVYAFANFSSIFSGLFNLMDFRLAHVIGTSGSVIFSILVMSSHTLIASCVNLFLISISLTVIITSSLLICVKYSKYFESNSLTYVMLLLGNVIALAGNRYSVLGFDVMDYCIVLPFLII